MKVIFLVAFFTVASTAEIKKNYPALPRTHYEEEDYPAVPYDFAYAIKDDPTYNDFGRQESSDGKVVKGSYQVALPDGRTQIVSYTADEYGYHSDVKYEGEARYPEYKPQPPYAAPAAYPKAAYPKASYPKAAYSKAAYSEPLYHKIEPVNHEQVYKDTEVGYTEPLYSKTT